MPTTRIFKYKDKIELISKERCSCPPSDAAEKTLDAFRRCKNPLSSECFLPQAVKNPPRLLKANSFEEKCSCWGLSMHTSLRASQTAFPKSRKKNSTCKKAFWWLCCSWHIDTRERFSDNAKPIWSLRFA